MCLVTCLCEDAVVRECVGDCRMLGELIGWKPRVRQTHRVAATMLARHRGESDN